MPRLNFKTPTTPSRPVNAQATPRVVAETPVARASIGTEYYEFTVENAYGFFGPQTLCLKDIGLTNVVGRNMETVKVSSSGAGKSRFFTLFSYLQYGTVALGKGETVSGMRSFGSNFMLRLRLRRGNKFYELRETYKHKDYPDGLVLLEFPDDTFTHGVATGAVNNPVGLRRDYQHIISLTYEEYIGTVILPQNFGHTLIHGLPSQRIQWLSELYGLTAYADVCAALDVHLSKTRAEINALLEVRGKYAVIADEIAEMTTDADISVVEGKLKKLVADVVAFETRIDNARRQLDVIKLRLSTLQQMQQSIDNANQQDLAGDERAKAIEGVLVKEFEAAAAVVRRDLSALEQLSDVQTQLRDIDAQLSALHVQDITDSDRALSTRLATVEIPDLQRQARMTQDTEAAVRQVIADLQSDLATNVSNANLPCDRAGVSRVLSETNALIETEKANQAVLSQRMRQLEHALAMHQDCVCPQCLQEVKNRDLLVDYYADTQAKLKSSSEVLTALHYRAVSAQDMLDILNDLENATSVRLPQAIATEKAKLLLVEAQQQLLGLQTRLRDFDRNQHLIGQRTILQQRLGGHTEDVSAQISDLKALTCTHVAIRERYYNAEAAFNAVYGLATQLQIDDPFSLDLAGELNELAQRRDHAESWLVRATQQKDAARLQMERWRALVSRYHKQESVLATLSVQLRRLEELEDNELVLAADKKAYDKSGMKIARLKELLDRISSGLPIWTRVLFTEPYFEVKVDGDRDKKLSLLVKKRALVDGKECITWIDASELSGGEESRFALCLMLTLMNQVAPEKRTNVIVIDEADKGLDDLGKRLMAEMLLPMMRAEKPSMLVITHQLEIDPGVINAHLVVTKATSGLSSIEFLSTNRLAHRK